MGTRAQIRIKGDVDGVHIYKHSDGYPEDVLKTLIPFVKDFHLNRGCGDSAYLLCQLVRTFAVRDYIEQQNDDWYKENPEAAARYKYLGWGLDCETHGDIDFLYEIDAEGNIYINGKKQTNEMLKEYV